MGNDIDSMLKAARQALGGDEKRLNEAAKYNPSLAKLISSMKPEEAKKLMSILNDPEESKRLLATPQAQKLMDSLRRQKGNLNG